MCWFWSPPRWKDKENHRKSVQNPQEIHEKKTWKTHNTENVPIAVGTFICKSDLGLVGDSFCGISGLSFMGFKQPCYGGYNGIEWERIYEWEYNTNIMYRYLLANQQ